MILAELPIQEWWKNRRIRLNQDDGSRESA